MHALHYAFLLNNLWCEIGMENYFFPLERILKEAPPNVYERKLRISLPPPTASCQEYYHREKAAFVHWRAKKEMSAESP